MQNIISAYLWGHWSMHWNRTLMCLVTFACLMKHQVFLCVSKRMHLIPCLSSRDRKSWCKLLDRSLSQVIVGRKAISMYLLQWVGVLGWLSHKDKLWSIWFTAIYGFFPVVIICTVSALSVSTYNAVLGSCNVQILFFTRRQYIA